MNPAMRRIPLQRSLDQALPLSHVSRPRVPSSACRTAAITSASFSSTPSHALLDIKQDRKKHMAQIRRWQRRIFGDSEPIGSRVDPYDPNSPIRIAPEETGEEQEFIEGSVVHDEALGEEVDYIPYEEAESGKKLIRIGTKEWVRERGEREMVERFEELVGRSYPVLRYRFGPEEPIKNRKALAEHFHRAVVEVYTLKEAGLNMDLASYAHGGDYNAPINFADVQFTASSNELVLTYRTAEAKAQLLEQIQKVAAEPTQQEADYLVDEAEELLDEAESAKKKEPDAPGSKRAALVKQDVVFDFMSNRPVPRAKPAAPVAEKVIPAEQPAKELDLHTAAEESRKAISAIRSTVLEALAAQHEQSLASMRQAIRGDIEKLASESITVTKVVPVSESESMPVSKSENKLRQIHITDPAVKFALYKRLLQTTGVRIPDFQLNSVRTLGDMLTHLNEFSAPKSGKTHGQIAKPTKLGGLANVRVHAKPVTEMQREKAVGRWKVIEYALQERGLPVHMKKKNEGRLKIKDQLQC